MKDGWCVF